MDTPVSTAPPTRIVTGGAQAVPLPHSERVQRPHPEPAALRGRSRCYDPGRPAQYGSQNGSRCSERGLAADLADRRTRRRCAGSQHGRPADDPDRHRGRFAAGARRGARHADRLQLQPQRHRGPEYLEPRASSRAGGAGRRHRRLLRSSPVKTLILYNDAPAPVPAFDPRFDYYTGDHGSNRNRRRTDHPAGLRSQHPDHHADPGSGQGPASHSIWLRCNRRCRLPTRHPSPLPSCRKRSMTRPSTRRRPRIRTREFRTPL